MKSSDLLLELKVKSPSIFLKTVLFITAIIPLSIILGILIFIEEIESPFGVFIGFLFLGAISFVLFRLLLWNNYGKEVYLFKQGEVTMYNDYNYFKDNQRTVKITSKPKVYYSDLDEQRELFELSEDNLRVAKPKSEYVVTFLIDEVEHTSVIKLNTQDLQQLAKQVKPLLA